MKVAHLANFYGPTSGGLRTAMHALGAGYLQRGHTNVLIVPSHADATEDTPFGTRISIRSPRIPFSGGYRIITNTAKVRKALAAFAPDVIEVSDRTTLRGIGSWARQRGIPSVFFAHERADGILNANLPRWIARPRWVTRAANWHNKGTRARFTAVVCTTDFALAEFSRAGLDAVKVPLGVDLERFGPHNYSAALREEYAQGATHLLLMASRLSKEKRPELAIDAVRLLHEQGVSVRLLCAGTGNIDAAMRERAAGLPVTFLGFVTDKELFARLLASADAVVAPGPIETFGLAALEALASGTPTVVNANSALPEVVGEAGVKADSRPEDFAAAIRSVLEGDEGERRRKARSRAETMPWSRTVDSMLELHERHLKSK